MCTKNVAPYMFLWSTGNTVPAENNFPMGIFWNILEYYGTLQIYPGYHGIFKNITILLYSRAFHNILECYKTF